MKVISGRYKGRNIDGFHLNGTRPTMDRVKESLFAMIQEDIKESIVLDLFSGSGNLAIESISQGAKFAYCNDKGKEAYKIMKKNIENLKIENQVEVMNLDYQKALAQLREKRLTFDLVFLDPPYDTDLVEKSLLFIKKYHMLKENGKIICEVDKLSRIPMDLSYSVIKERKYGDKYVVILT